MKLSFKETIWFQVTVPEILEDQFIEALVNSRIENSNDAIELLNNILPFDNIDGIHNLDTTDQMIASDNDGYSTIELMDSYGDIIWQNGEDILI